MTTEQVMREVMRDINYYDSTGGGVTFTGGEPFCQPDFLMALLRASSRMYLNAAVETCGAGKLEDYKRAMPLLDMFFLDVKCADPTKSEDWLGCKLDKLLADIRAISRFALEFDVRLFIRIPIIPGFNDTIEDIGAIAEFINELPRVDGVELLPYHKLGRGKYRLVGRNYSLWDLETPQQNFIAKLSDIIRKTGIDEVSF
jgi:pyruvate formate lyase activating enzyme